jgi:hypothetical protein
MSTPPSQTAGYTLSIQLMKRVLATHTRYVGEELLQQLDEGKSGTASGGGGASAHIRVDWDAPFELQGYGIVVYFVMGSPDEKEKHFARGRSTKNYTATETQAYQAKAAKSFVRSVRIAPTTPVKNSPTGPLG